ncbi:MAG: hypothetical protein JXA14_19685 [Anaerolineae bacterium]|nr:hypothetical protein [Anaerolineae bacterium]
MIDNQAPKVQRILGAALAAVLLLALTVGLNDQPVAQARAQTEDLSASVERVSPAAIGTAFSYQGRLDDGGGPANGMYTFRFRLYASLTGTDQVGDTVVIEDKQVSDGLFSVQLDFGQVFDGTALYLETAVRPAAETGEFDVLSPRQPLSPAPYALHAASIADGAVTASSIGEQCGYGQVLADTGGGWTCADAQVQFAPQQVLSYTVVVDSTTMAGVKVDFSSLSITTAIAERHPLPYLTSKDVGFTNYANFFLICTQPCPFLDDWYDDIVSYSAGGGGPASPQYSVDIIIYNGVGQETQRWSGDYCWPSELAAELGPDGGTLYSRYQMACDTLDLVLP